MNFFKKVKKRINWEIQKPIERWGKTLPDDIENDKKYLTVLYRRAFGKKPDFDNPRTYNEKLQWLKLYNRRPEYTMMVDKYEVKDYVASVIGEEYVIKALGVWDKFEDIDFDSLPERFVLKCTHDSGGIAICRDKVSFDKEKAGRVLGRSLCNNYYYRGREWPYKNVKPRIIAEEYLEDESDGELRDYKFFCFNGEVKAMYVNTDRFSSGGTCSDFFDADFNHLPFRHGYPNAKTLPHKPENFELMKELAGKLSRGIPHARIDFYEVNGKVYFGEITFFHWSGLTPFKPEEWDYTFGSWLTLPEKN